MTLPILAGVLPEVSAHAGAVVYQQPSDFPNGGFFFSLNDQVNFPNASTTYDNFTLAANTLITDVHWQGGYGLCGEQCGDGNPPPGIITGFTVAFRADASGQPGGVLLSAALPGTAGETFVGLENGLPIFDYGVDLPTAFHAIGGTTYWLSIVADLTALPVWGWHTATGGDGIAFIDFFGTRSQLAVDLAFALTVPEPASLVLLGAGLAGLAAWRWRRNRRD